MTDKEKELLTLIKKNLKGYTYEEFTNVFYQLRKELLKELKIS